MLQDSQPPSPRETQARHCGETQRMRVEETDEDLKLGGGFKYFLFSPLLGEDSHFD